MPTPPPAAARFDAPASILHGGGARDHLPALVHSLEAKRPLIVTDPGVVKLGWADELRTMLEADHLAVALFDGVQPDPTDSNVSAGVDALRAHDADIVIAVGGGSPIDIAKVVAARPANPQPLPDYAGYHQIARFGVPMIAVPTTAGTGSEATKVAVITDTERQVKMMMLAMPLMPRAAVVDYELTMSMPRPLTAAVGVDTLTHGIEAYVSRKANAMTDPLALSCIGLVGRCLARAWRDSQDADAREGMMLAACHGGMAFSNSSVCLVHGMSRPIGALFHVPHGLSNAVLLPTVTRYSINHAAPRYAAVARALNAADATADDADACARLVDWLEALNHELELPRLRDCCGVDRDAFESHLARMAADALASGSPANNPRVPDAAQIIELYREAW
ncbi:MAG: iron-containing alcohol dehydrogenase [Phycisphaeraceae bacterium]